MLPRLAAACAALSMLAPVVRAHVGSPDIYLDAKAGPYTLFVTIRPPLVIPGVAELEVRSADTSVTAIEAVPLPMTGPGAKFAPVPDKLVVSKQDPQLFTGALWLMAPGSWQVRLTVAGKQGSAPLAIPVSSAALTTRRMQPGLGLVLLLLGLFLVAGAIAIAGASVREARLEPGLAPGTRRVRAGRVAMCAALICAAVVLWAGDRWWGREAASYAEDVYKPLDMTAALSPSYGLRLTLKDPGWLNAPGWGSLFTRSVDDFVPDHNHLMHLYAIRQPGLDVIYHLHPEPAGPGVFQMALPSMPAGHYRLYADVVHANGFPETLVSNLTLTQPVSGRPFTLDEASGSAAPWQASQPDTSEFQLPDGYRMLWLRAGQSLRARRPALLHFRLTKPDGAAADDMKLYMGMSGHAAFVKTDGSVFAHVHPSGTVSMAALELAARQNPQSMPGMDMAAMHHPAASTQAAYSIPNEVSFPYGFPSPGRYRIVVQMKHGDTIETGIFDASVL